MAGTFFKNRHAEEKIQRVVNFFCNILIIGILGIVSSQASGYDEYLKELGELKNISEEALSKKPEIQTNFKSEYNELARSVNKYIDYFIQIIDGKTEFDFSEIDKITKSINQRAVNLKKRLLEIDNKSEMRAFLNPMVVIPLALVTINVARAAYDFFKELKNDYEKYKIKKDLISYQWKNIK